MLSATKEVPCPKRPGSHEHRVIVMLEIEISRCSVKCNEIFKLYYLGLGLQKARNNFLVLGIVKSQEIREKRALTFVHHCYHRISHDRVGHTVVGRAGHCRLIVSGKNWIDAKSGKAGGQRLHHKSEWKQSKDKGILCYLSTISKEIRRSSTYSH